jgi:uncharacterized OsmC-like protein
MSDAFTVDLHQQAGYRFEARFDDPDVAALTVDEPPPLGASAGPDPARVLAVSVGHCLSASLLFALRKFGNDPARLWTRVSTTMSRNERGRLRIGRIAADLHLGVEARQLARLDRALAQFEDFCTVTATLRGAVPVDVRVLDAHGTVVHGGADAPPREHAAATAA